MLAVVVTLFMVAVRGVLWPALKRLQGVVVDRIEQGFKRDLHTLPFGSGN
jgi:hypothetical protein